MGHVDVCVFLEDLGRHALRGAGTRRGIVKLAGIGLAVLDQFLQRTDRHLGIDHHHQWHGADYHHRGEVLDDVVTQAPLLQGGHGGVRRECAHEQRIAVWRAPGDHFSANVAARASPVVNDHLLAQYFAQAGGNDATDHVRSAARRIRYDQPDRLVRIGRERGRCKGESGHGGKGQQACPQQGSASRIGDGEFHVVSGFLLSAHPWRGGASCTEFDEDGR